MFLHNNVRLLPIVSILFLVTPSLSQVVIDQYDDLAIGFPFANSGRVLATGMVHICFGGASQFQADRQYLSKDDPEIAGTATAGERFGAALTKGDFNGDGYQDLAVGVPYETVAGAAEAGTVYVFYGYPTGLRSRGSQVWYQGLPGTGSVSEDGDNFGFALAAGDFNKDGFVDLAIGIPGKMIGGNDTAGAVWVLYGSSTGLTGNGSQVWHQNVAGIEGVPEQGDYFGYSLATGDFNGDGYADLVIGVPFEDIEVVMDAGAVNIIYGSADGLTAVGNQLWYEDLLTLTSEAGDFFGWALAAGDFNMDGRADLAIGSHGKDLGGSDRGAVTVMYGTRSGLSAVNRDYWRQSVLDILGTEKDGDYFGLALSAGDFNGDGYADLAIGVPGDDYSGIAGAGAVNVIYGSLGGLTAINNQIWHQDLLDNSPAELNDGFGRALTTGDFNGDGFSDLVVGVPNEDYLGQDNGLVHIIFGSVTRLTAANNLVFEGVNGDRFGSALAAGRFGKPAGLLFLPLIFSN